jgi:hypothetical protein
MDGSDEVAIVTLLLHIIPIANKMSSGSNLTAGVALRYRRVPALLQPDSSLLPIGFTR